MSLDDRLIDILQHTTQAESIPLQVAQIKAALAEEGYHIGKQVNVTTPNYMTGQEWYDRFEKELQGKAFPYEGRTDQHIVNAIKEVTAAARKAAGL